MTETKAMPLTDNSSQEEVNNYIGGVISSSETFSGLQELISLLQDGAASGTIPELNKKILSNQSFSKAALEYDGLKELLGDVFCKAAEVGNIAWLRSVFSETSVFSSILQGKEYPNGHFYGLTKLPRLMVEEAVANDQLDVLDFLLQKPMVVEHIHNEFLADMVSDYGAEYPRTCARLCEIPQFKDHINKARELVKIVDGLSQQSQEPQIEQQVAAGKEVAKL